MSLLENANILGNVGRRRVRVNTRIGRTKGVEANERDGGDGEDDDDRRKQWQEEVFINVTIPAMVFGGAGWVVDFKMINIVSSDDSLGN